MYVTSLSKVFMLQFCHNVRYQKTSMMGLLGSENSWTKDKQVTSISVGYTAVKHSVLFGKKINAQNIPTVTNVIIINNKLFGKKTDPKDRQAWRSATTTGQPGRTLC